MFLNFTSSPIFVAILFHNFIIHYSFQKWICWWCISSLYASWNVSSSLFYFNFYMPYVYTCNFPYHLLIFFLFYFMNHPQQNWKDTQCLLANKIKLKTTKSLYNSFFAGGCILCLILPYSFLELPEYNTYILSPTLRKTGFSNAVPRARQLYTFSYHFFHANTNLIQKFCDKIKMKMKLELKFV